MRRSSGKKCGPEGSLALRGMLGRLLPYAMLCARLECGDPRHCPVNVDVELGLVPAQARAASRTTTTARKSVPNLLKSCALVSQPNT